MAYRICPLEREMGIKCDRNESSTVPPTGSTTPAPPKLSARLVGGNNKNYGTLQIYEDRYWKTVCYHDMFRNYYIPFVRTVCRQLGYSYGMLVNGSMFYPVEKGRMNVDYIFDCSFHNRKIDDCRRDEVSNYYATTRHCKNHKNDVGMVCYGSGEKVQNLPSRLVDGPDPSEGRLEVKFNDEWGSVCLYYFTYKFQVNYTQIVCNQLGYERGIRVNPNRVYKQSKAKVILWNLECKRSMTSLDQCSHTGYGFTDYMCHSHEYDVGIKCYNGTTLHMDSRLIASNDTIRNASLVQVKFDDKWGTVCPTLFLLYSNTDNYSTTNFAKVACRQNGYYGGMMSPPIRQAYLAADLKKIQPWAEQIICHGEEKSVGDCLFNHGIGYISSSCQSDKAGFGVVCFCEDYKIPIRLRSNQSAPYEGRLEVYLLNRWGTVCHAPGISGEFAPNACRALGYTGGRPELDSYQQFGLAKDTMPINMAGVNCKSGETNFAHCDHVGFGMNVIGCDHKSDIGVRCDETRITTPTNSPITTAKKKKELENGGVISVDDSSGQTGSSGPSAEVLVPSIVVPILVIIAVIALVVYGIYRTRKRDGMMRFNDETSSVGSGVPGILNPVYFAADAVPETVATRNVSENPSQTSPIASTSAAYTSSPTEADVAANDNPPIQSISSFPVTNKASGFGFSNVVYDNIEPKVEIKKGISHDNVPEYEEVTLKNQSYI